MKIKNKITLGLFGIISLAFIQNINAFNFTITNRTDLKKNLVVELVTSDTGIGSSTRIKKPLPIKFRRMLFEIEGDYENACLEKINVYDEDGDNLLGEADLKSVETCGDQDYNLMGGRDDEGGFKFIIYPAM